MDSLGWEGGGIEVVTGSLGVSTRRACGSKPGGLRIGAVDGDKSSEKVRGSSGKYSGTSVDVAG